MIDARRFLAVVPARGGSKSVPRKNIRPLAGRPLLAWTADQIAAVPEIDLAVVSTDDEEIATVAADVGLRVVRRPMELATDTAPTEWALEHALDALDADGEPPFDYVMVLEPTSPLRRPETIRHCMQTIIGENGESLMTVVESRANIGGVADGRFRPLVADAPRRRQDREPFYLESSTLYIASTEYLRRAHTLVHDDWLAVTVDPDEAVDINTPVDFAHAEALLGSRTALGESRE